MAEKEKTDVYASLGDKRKKFLNWQWRIIIVTMIGYALFYFVRKNMSVAMPGITAEYGITNKSFGWIIFAGSLVYGLSRFINGYTVDKFKGRLVMSVGLLLCAVSNFLFGAGANLSTMLTHSYQGPDFINMFILVMGITIILNQFFQGMGYPPCARILPHWIHPSQLATKMSVWNCSHSVGAALAVVVCGAIMGSLGTDMSSHADVVARITANLTNNDVADATQKALVYAAHYGAWKWCFWIPACLALAGAVFLFTCLRDEPKDVGLPDLPGTKLKVTESKNPKAKAKFEKVMVWTNRWVWTFCIANLFVYIVRMSILDWGPKFLTEASGLDITKAAWTTAGFEIAGIIGTLSWGYITDRVFKGKGHHTCVVCMLGAAVFMAIFFGMVTMHVHNMLYITIVLMCAGFCIYGPQALIGIELGNQATKEASARANGIAGILGYLGSGLSGLIVGYVADAYGWAAVFGTMIVVALIGMLVLISMWKAPRDGYERANSINYDE